MSEVTRMPVGAYQYAVEVPVDAPSETVWKALTQETNSWWLPDFHMVSRDSEVTFDTEAGGGLIEKSSKGSLLWYTTTFCRPGDFTIYLVGDLAPDWGGPSTSHMKFSITQNDSGCIVQANDAIFGHVTESGICSLKDGWEQLLTEGLKAFVENGKRQDQN